MSVNNPTLSTTPDQTSVTLGPPVTLKDTADLEGGSNPTGIITFTLVGPDGTTVVDTEMVLVNGNGLYSTPTGFTPGGPPGGAAHTGTSPYSATYSGDANNNAASDIDDPTEQVTVIACYCRGTLILTPAGKVPVEELAIGDRIVALAEKSGRSAGSDTAPMTAVLSPATGRCCRSASR